MQQQQQTDASQQQHPRKRLPMIRGGRWSRSLDDPVAFEEAVMAGRGSRQLPTVGPQQLASAMMRGRGMPPTSQPNQPYHQTGSGGRRELPRPGTTIGFATGSHHGYPLQHQQQGSSVAVGVAATAAAGAISESEDDDDWC